MTKNPNGSHQRITLAKLIKNDDPIWVINKAKSTRNGKPGQLVFQIGTGDQRDKIVLPPGPDPVCLTDLASKESLAQSRDLFLHISNGALQLLDPTQADDYYNQNEKRRNVMQKKVQVLRNSEVLPETPAPQSGNESAVEVDQRVVSVCLKVKTNALTEDEAIENLTEAGIGTYKAEDLIYVRNVCKGKKLKAWAQDQINALSIDG